MRLWAYVSVGLAPASLALTLDYFNTPTDARPLYWAVAGVLVIVLAEWLVRRSGEARRPLIATTLGRGVWRTRFTAPLLIVGYGASAYAASLAVTAFLRSPEAPAGRLAPTPIVAAITVLIGLWMLCACARRASFFIYPAALAGPAVVTWSARAFSLRGGSPLTVPADTLPSPYTSLRIFSRHSA
jgi:hypothetical protein